MAGLRSGSDAAERRAAVAGQPLQVEGLAAGGAERVEERGLARAGQPRQHDQPQAGEPGRPVRRAEGGCAPRTTEARTERKSIRRRRSTGAREDCPRSRTSSGPWLKSRCAVHIRECRERTSPPGGRSSAFAPGPLHHVEAQPAAPLPAAGAAAAAVPHDGAPSRPAGPLHGAVDHDARPGHLLLVHEVGPLLASSGPRPGRRTDVTGRTGSTRPSRNAASPPAAAGSRASRAACGPGRRGSSSRVPRCRAGTGAAAPPPPPPVRPARRRPVAVRGRLRRARAPPAPPGTAARATRPPDRRRARPAPATRRPTPRWRSRRAGRRRTRRAPTPGRGRGRARSSRCWPSGGAASTVPRGDRLNRSQRFHAPPELPVAAPTRVRRPKTSVTTMPWISARVPTVLPVGDDEPVVAEEQRELGDDDLRDVGRVGRDVAEVDGRVLDLPPARAGHPGELGGRRDHANAPRPPRPSRRARGVERRPGRTSTSRGGPEAYSSAVR